MAGWRGYLAYRPDSPCRPWRFRSDRSVIGPDVTLPEVSWARIEALLPDRAARRVGRRRVLLLGVGAKPRAGAESGCREPVQRADAKRMQRAGAESRYRQPVRTRSGVSSRPSAPVDAPVPGVDTPAASRSWPHGQRQALLTARAPAGHTPRPAVRAGVRTPARNRSTEEHLHGTPTRFAR